MTYNKGTYNSGTYNSRGAAVSRLLSAKTLPYFISSDVSTSFDLPYDDVTILTSYYELPYENADFTPAPYVLPYALSVSVSASYELDYNLVNNVSEEYELPYALSVDVSEEYELPYDDVSTVTSSYELPYTLSVDVSEEYELPYDDATSIVASFELDWDITDKLLGTYELPYALSTEPGREFILPWDIIPQPIAAYTLPWKFDIIAGIYDLEYDDAAIVKKTVTEYYNSETKVTSWKSLPYRDMKSVKRAVSTSWDLLFDQVKSAVLPFNILGETVSISVEEAWDLREREKLTKSFILPFHMFSENTEVLSNDIIITVEGTEISILSLELSGSIDEYCFSGTIIVAYVEDYSFCKYLDDVVVTVNSQSFNMFISSKTRTVQHGEVQYELEILSPTAKLDTPYSKTLVQSFSSAVSAKDLVEEMAAIQNISVDYQIIDWMIPSYAISISDETPLEVIRKIVNAVGGVVQTKPNGDLYIISRYPTSPANWGSVTPSQTISIDSDIAELKEELEVNDGFNAFVVTNEGSSSDSITLEAEDVDSTTKLIKGFQVPFDTDSPLTLETSGGDDVTIEVFTEPVLENMPIVEDSDDDEWEIVEFIDFTGQTSKPIYTILETEWQERDLGAIQFSEDGTLEAVDQSGQYGESLLKIKYQTKYWKWIVRGTVDTSVQLYIPETEDA